MNESPRYIMARDALGYFARDTHNGNEAVRDAAGYVMYRPSFDAPGWVAEMNRWDSEH